MHSLLDHTVVHAPGGAGEAIVLGLALAVTFLAAWHAVSAWFAGVLTAASSLGFIFVGHPALPLAVAAVVLLAAIRYRRGEIRSTTHAAHFGRELAVILGAFVVYEALRIQIEGEFADAHANAMRIIDFERALGLYFEPPLQELVRRSDTALRAFNTVYSFAFLAIAASTLVWLYLADRPNYRLYRNCLGISVVLAVVTIAAVPVAPPRLVPESGLMDSVVLMGREHQFANEYAAVPSLHVGWMALAGFVLGRSIGGRRGFALGWIPGLGMGLTVVMTGNHYWIDGAVGAAYCVGPALLLTRGRAWLERCADATKRAARATQTTLQRSGRAQFSAVLLALLVGFLAIGDIVRPGFTDFWGYLIFQMTATLILLVAGEVVFAEKGGLSWQTHILAVACGYADVFGTAGDLYANIDEYDKLTHFMGVAAITSGAYDIFRLVGWRRADGPLLQSRMMAAIAVGMATGIAWEVYELAGDKVFHTARVQGQLDTFNDIIFDGLGAIAAGFVLSRAERAGRTEPEPQPVPAPEQPGG